MANNTESVREFILETINRWVEEEGSSGDVGTAYSLLDIRTKIKEHEMLSRVEAYMLKDKLEKELEEKLDNWRHTNRNSIIAVGDLSYYYDAWNLYCRPGTYTI